MTGRLAAFASLLALAITGCTDGNVADPGSPGGGKADGYGTCESEPKYGDGTCHSDLSCGVPDIDCFITFATDAEANQWYAGIEGQVAAQSGAAPRMLVPETDPRFVRSRLLVDRAWDLYRSRYPLGALADKRVGLVLLETPKINAFVTGDWTTGNAALSIHILTGLLALDVTDDEIMAVLIHELAHIAGLHTVPGVRDRIRRFYIAEPGNEPIGAQQAEHARARELGGKWRELSIDAGTDTTAMIGDLPLGGRLAWYAGEVFYQAQNYQASCATPVNALEGLMSSIDTKRLPLDHSLDPAEIASVAPLAANLWASLRACTAGFSRNYIDVMAEGTGMTYAEYTASLTPEDQALIANKGMVDAMVALIADRRSRMRELEVQFARETGQPWSALRFFSTEEEADDATVPTLREGKMEPTALGGFFGSYLKEPALCEAKIAEGAAPYGTDLLDEHHASCWRIGHVRQLADPPLPAGSSARASQREAVVDPTPIRRTRLPMPARITDIIIY